MAGSAHSIAWQASSALPQHAEAKDASQARSYSTRPRRLFGTGPLGDLESNELYRSMGIIQSGIHRAQLEVEQVNMMAKTAKNKRALLERRGEILSEIRELEHELVNLHSESMRRRHLGAVKIGAKLQLERRQMIGKTAPLVLPKPKPPPESKEPVLQSRVRPDFVRRTLPLLENARHLRS